MTQFRKDTLPALAGRCLIRCFEAGGSRLFFCAQHKKAGHCANYSHFVNNRCIDLLFPAYE
ncbi:hypothetical protein B5F87_15330 [Eubacterium sp. An3]|nr:hypothetical protein B5F87_15330 [Eubacterium sp. An3]